VCVVLFIYVYFFVNDDGDVYLGLHVYTVSAHLERKNLS
jgi:hypothetical protein